MKKLFEMITKQNFFWKFEFEMITKQISLKFKIWDDHKAKFLLRKLEFKDSLSGTRNIQIYEG